MTDANTNNDMDEKKPMKDELNEADSVNAEVDLDDSKAKFLNGGKGIDEEAQCVVEVASDSVDVSFTGLGKDELMKYANDPFWKRMRIILFVLFWVGWLAMLVAAIVIIVLAPRCPYRPDLKWYHKESVYRVYPKSFQDSNGDGVGDIKGIHKRVPYITELGAKVISFGSIFEKDTGNGILDHKKVDPKLGTVGEIQAMLAEFKKSGTKIILDFIPNHTSKNHTWFVESMKTKDNQYANYYVWADKVGGAEPNNWKRDDGLSAWTYVTERDQYYLGQKGSNYPDLNLENEEVKKEMEGILRFWLDMGIGGFNVLDIKYLVENSNLTEETTPGSQTHHQPGSIAVINYFRKLLDSYSDKPGRERVLMGVVPDDATDNQTLAYYGTKEMPGLHLVVDEKVAASLTSICNGACVKDIIETELNAVNDGINKWMGWMVGNEDRSRISQRMGSQHELSALVLQLMLPGTPVMYYGDEVGMKDGTFSTLSIANVSTDSMELEKMKYRTPMQWNVSVNSGFTYGTPWLPVNDNYMDNNVAAENAHYRKGSVYKKVKEILKIRKSDGESESIMFGKTTTGIVADDLFWFTRQAVGFPGYLVAINFGNAPVTHLFAGDLYSSKAKVVFHSTREIKDDMIDIEKTYIEFQSGESIILKLDN